MIRFLKLAVSVWTRPGELGYSAALYQRSHPPSGVWVERSMKSLEDRCR